MKKYLVVFKISIASLLEYRSNLILQILGSIIFFAALTLLWVAIYEGKQSIGDFTKAEMITYILGGSIVSGYISYVSIGDEIALWIRRGNLSLWLTRPFNMQLNWFANDLARRIFNFFISGIALLIVALLFFGKYLIFQHDIAVILLTIFIIFLAGIINYLMFQTIATFSFWMEETWGLQFVVRMFLMVAGGSLIPLSFLQGPIGIFLNYLPFKYMAYVPMQAYLGKISENQMWIAVLGEFTWIILLWFLSQLVWRSGIKHYTAVGG